MMIKNRLPAAVALLLALPACADQPTAGAPASTPVPAPDVVAELRCRVELPAGSLSCAPAAGGAVAGARRSLVTVGGQHHYVRLANGGTVADAVAGTFATTVTVQNLLLAALGTQDGSAPHASGVRVFFASGPTNGVTVANATGQDVFLGSAQDYFEYEGAELGADGILSPDETSTGKEWRFATNGASSFGFTVYVQGQVPDGTAHTAHLTRVSGGAYHACGLTAAGKAYCWGYDVKGQLGNGGVLTTNRGVPSPVQMPAGVGFTDVSAGYQHGCALGDDGLAYCWGEDNLGQLGNGAANTGDRDAPSPVQMPAGVEFTTVSAGYSHSCALSTDGRVFCWGDDTYGQLGNGAVPAESQPAPVEVELPAGVTFTRLAAGVFHTCALSPDDAAFCWGWDEAGQLGNGAALTGDQPAPTPVEMPAGVGFTDITAGHTHSCALGSDGQAYCWGRDANGQLGNGTTLTGDQAAPTAVEAPAGVAFTGIVAEFYQSCALAADGRAFCWGRDSNGQLGNGTALTDDRHTPSPVQMPAGVTFTGLSGGHSAACGVSAGPVYCWGYNESREVGDGTAVDRHAPVVVAGTR